MPIPFLQKRDETWKRCIISDACKIQIPSKCRVSTIFDITNSSCYYTGVDLRTNHFEEIKDPVRVLEDPLNEHIKMISEWEPNLVIIFLHIKRHDELIWAGLDIVWASKIRCKLVLIGRQILCTYILVFWIYLGLQNSDWAVLYMVGKLTSKATTFMRAQGQILSF